MYHGKPCWFERAAPTGTLAATGDFYASVLGWQIADAGMEGFTYHLASHGGDMIAGLYEGDDTTPNAWGIYFDVDDADAAAAKIRTLGGTILQEPMDIPGTGRFVAATDPQGARFAVLQPEPMDPQPPVDSGAWNQQKESHGNWVELMSTDPEAGFDFYAEMFGWAKSDAMPMGEMGNYQLFTWQGTQIGGMMGPGNAPAPCWLPYFGVNGVDAAITRIKDAGGALVHGPVEVPGPAFIAVVHDPQGGHFAIVGPKEHTT